MKRVWHNFLRSSFNLWHAEQILKIWLNRRKKITLVKIFALHLNKIERIPILCVNQGWNWTSGYWGKKQNFTLHILMDVLGWTDKLSLQKFNWGFSSSIILLCRQAFSNNFVGYNKREILLIDNKYIKAARWQLVKYNTSCDIFWHLIPT